MTTEPHHTGRAATGTRTGSGTSERIAVVTGGANGIGHAVSRLLLDNRSKVLSIDRVPAEHLGADPDRFKSLTVDVRKEKALDTAREQLLSDWSAPDLVVITAGVARSDRFTTDWDELFDVGGRGVVETTRVFLPDLLAAVDDGRVADLVVVGAMADEFSRGDSSIFAAAAAAVRYFVAGLRVKFRERGLRVIHVAPGYVDTGDAQVIDQDADDDSPPRGMSPESLRPKDVAEVIQYILDQPPEVTIGEMVMVSTRQNAPR